MEEAVQQREAQPEAEISSAENTANSVGCLSWQKN
jgi:hypothetical protein